MYSKHCFIAFYYGKLLVVVFYGKILCVYCEMLNSIKCIRKSLYLIPLNAISSAYTAVNEIVLMPKKHTYALDILTHHWKEQFQINSK